MNRRINYLSLLFLLLLLPWMAVAKSPAEKPGEVRLSLEDYNRLVNQAARPPKDPRPVPAGYALGQANVGVAILHDGSRASAEVRAA